MGYLQIHRVSKTLGRVHTLDNISLSVNQHESVVILGPSGCGKSTLLNIVAGLISPDKGQILIDEIGRKDPGELYAAKICFCLPAIF